MKIYILLGIIITLIFLLILVYLIEKKSRKSNKNYAVIKNKKKHDIFEKLYLFANSFILTQRYIRRIKSQVEKNDLSDQWSIHKKSIKIMLLTLGLSLGIVCFMLYFKVNLFIVCVLIYGIYMIHTQVLKWIVRNTDDKLLGQFEKFIGHVRHHYHEHGMIDEAIYDSIEESEYEISLHANRMYEILIDNDVEERLSEYYDSGINKYFKTFLALCHTVQVYGDQKVDGAMLFLSNLNYLKEEINLEMLRRMKLKHLFRSLNFIVVAPAFFLMPIEKWAISNMSDLSYYYKGGYGFLVKVIIIAMVMACFQLISRMQDNPNSSMVFSDYFEKRLLKIKGIKKRIRNLRYQHYNKYLKQEGLLRSLGSTITVDIFIIKRLIWGVLGFVLSIIVVLNIHHLSRQSILYPHQLLEDKNVELDYDDIKAIAEFDYPFIKAYRGKNTSYQIIEEAVIEDGELESKTEIAIASKRILDKVNSYNRIYFKWWELIICIVTAYLTYMMPYILVQFKRKVLLLSMEDEVVQFNTIILMLMHVKRVSVEDILNYMELFSCVFKDSIQRCINDFEFGDIEALEQLKVDEPYLPFLRIVQKLQVAANKIPIVEAFDELKSDRLYYKDKRRQNNEMIIERKGLWGKIIAFTPFTLTISLYLLIPFIHYSIQQFISYSEQMSNYM